MAGKPGKHEALLLGVTHTSTHQPHHEPEI